MIRLEDCARNVIGLLIALLIGLLALEIGAFLLTKLGLLRVNETPKLYRTSGALPMNGYFSLGEFWTENSQWGAWHKVKSKTMHKASCFEVEYSSNEIGARDSSFAVTGLKKRYVLMGDSFAEGMGVGHEDTAQRIIEKTNGVDVLNFGSSGSLGPVQYWLLYDQLARSYQHDGLIIFFFPANDFTDNDHDYWTRTGLAFMPDGSERYRPYYRKGPNDSYDVFIPEGAVPRASLDIAYSGGSTWSLKSFIFDNFWTANVIRTAMYVLRSRQLEKEHPFSGYFDASEEQQSAAVYFIDRLITSAAVNDIILVAIPTLEDISRISSGADKRKMPWFRAFENASSRLSKQVTFVDLLEYVPSEASGIYIPCDGHWSPAGNKWVAGILASKMSIQ